jgi:hypothetical protein
VAATGVVVAGKRRAHHDYDPDELRDRLHRRLAEIAADSEGTWEPVRDPTAPSDD